MLRGRNRNRGLNLLSSAAPYLGQVASRTFAPNQYAGGQLTSMSRTGHLASTTITQLKLIFVGWYYSATAESNQTSGATWHASIEYPSGTIAGQALFSGSSAGVCAAGGMIISDWITGLNIPSGVRFWVRVHQAAPSGIIYRTTSGGTVFQGSAYGAAVADDTMNLNAVGGSALYIGPAGVIANTTVPSIAVLGDSRTVGISSFVDPTSGEISAAKSGLYDAPSIDFAISSTSTPYYLAATAPKRIALGAYCSHIFNYLGINDVNGGTTSAALLTNQQQVKADWGGKKMVCATLDPHSSSTDAWATTVNQTPNADNTNRTAYNDAIRAVPAWLSAYIEAADATESARNSGLWKPNDTADGLHSNDAGNSAGLASGVFTKSKFT
jgi:hypothetical protein